MEMRLEVSPCCDIPEAWPGVEVLGGLTNGASFNLSEVLRRRVCNHAHMAGTTCS